MLAAERTAAADRLVLALATAERTAELYPPGHPVRIAAAREVVEAVTALRGPEDGGELTLAVVNEQLQLGSQPLPRASVVHHALIERLLAAGLRTVTFGTALTTADVERLVAALASGAAPEQHGPGLRCNATAPGPRELPPWAAQLAVLRRSYAQLLLTARQLVAGARERGAVDLPMAERAVAALVDQHGTDPDSLVLLSALRPSSAEVAVPLVNVALLTVALGLQLGLRRDQVLGLGVGALLHDIGMALLPEELVTRAGPLDEEQQVLLQRHPVEGAAVLLASGPGLFHPATAVVLEHHVGVDGSGYPSLDDRGPSAPARIVAVVDTFEAVTSPRPYRAPLDRGAAVAVLASSAGRSLDPAAVGAFQRLLGRYPTGSLVELTSGELALVVGQHAADPDRPRVLVLLDASGNLAEIGERDLADRSWSGIAVHGRGTRPPAVDVAQLLLSGEVVAPRT